MLCVLVFFWSIFSWGFAVLLARIKLIGQNFELILMLHRSLSPEVRLSYFLLFQMLGSSSGRLKLPKCGMRINNQGHQGERDDNHIFKYAKPLRQNTTWIYLCPHMDCVYASPQRFYVWQPQTKIGTSVTAWEVQKAWALWSFQFHPYCLLHDFWQVIFPPSFSNSFTSLANLTSDLWRRLCAPNPKKEWAGVEPIVLYFSHDNLISHCMCFAIAFRDRQSFSCKFFILEMLSCSSLPDQYPGALRCPGDVWYMSLSMDKGTESNSLPPAQHNRKSI